MKLLDELKACGDWYDALSDQHALLVDLDDRLRHEEQAAAVLPARGQRLNALRHTPLASALATILAQDPYPGITNGVPHAMGLAFSVPANVPPPRSLNNIYKELGEDCGLNHPGHGDLSHWARAGVLLLNSVLTLRQGEAYSHANMGWEVFTRAVLACVNAKTEPVVFLSWGRPSHKLTSFIDRSRHLVIQTSHPSPLGARRSGADFDAFLGSGCFRRANAFLKAQGRPIIPWTQL